MAQTAQGKGAERIQEDVDLQEVTTWAAGVDALHTRIAHQFVRPEPCWRSLVSLKGLLGDVERKMAGN